MNTIALKCFAHSSPNRFYAPWCGHCQRLKPAYEKAAKNLEGLAKVAAVNCDDDSNKPFCGQMGVQGFPTLKLVTPSKKPGKPKVEDYQGPRSAKAIVDAVVERIPNHVKRVTDKELDGWLSASRDTAKAILFTEKGTTSALLRSLAIDFLGSIKFAQIRNKESSAVKKFGINKFPTLVLLPGGEKEPVTYDGELNKASMVTFFSQVASPNPDPVPKQSKPSKKDQKSKSTKATTSTPSKSRTSATTKPTGETKPSGTKSSTVNEESISFSTTEPSGERASSSTDSAPDGEENTSSSTTTEPQETVRPSPLPIIQSDAELRSTCLSSKSKTCVLVFASVSKSSEDKPAPDVLQSLIGFTGISLKHTAHKRSIFPFYIVPNYLEGVESLKTELGLDVAKSVDAIAVNGQRNWIRKYDSARGFGLAEVEAWIDSVRFNEGPKQKLPDGVISDVPNEGKKANKAEKEEEKANEKPEKSHEAPEHKEL